MPITVVQPSHVEAFRVSGACAIADKELAAALPELLRIMQSSRRQTHLSVPAYFIKEEQPGDLAHARNLGAKLGGLRTSPIETAVHLSPEEQTCVALEASQTHLGRRILASQGVPQYALEAKVLRQLVTFYNRSRTRSFREPPFGFDHLIARRAMEELYGEKRAPWICRDGQRWTRHQSSVCATRIEAYQKAFCATLREDMGVSC